VAARPFVTWRIRSALAASWTARRVSKAASAAAPTSWGERGPAASTVTRNSVARSMAVLGADLNCSESSRRAASGICGFARAHLERNQDLRNQQVAIHERYELAPLDVRHGDFIPYALLARHPPH